MKQDSLAGKVYVELRRKILSNQLVSGIRLKEEVWAKRMEVNRMAVREALNRLLGENLVEFGEKGGYFVKSLNAKDIKEIRELREVLELGALRIVFLNRDKGLLKKLGEICEDFTSMVNGGYFGGACEADVKFHEALIAGTANQKLMDLYQLSNIPLFHHKLGQSQHLNDYEQTDLEHRQILKALQENDFKLAEEAIVKHLIRGEVTVLDLD